jgi:hypothetical protein
MQCFAQNCCLEEKTLQMSKSKGLFDEQIRLDKLSKKQGSLREIEWSYRF